MNTKQVVGYSLLNSAETRPSTSKLVRGSSYLLALSLLLAPVLPAQASTKPTTTTTTVPTKPTTTPPKPTPVVVVAPAITTQPASSLWLNAGQSGTLSVVASGTSPTYQWYQNSVAIKGATSASLTISNSIVADDGLYEVTVTNSAGSVTSSPTELLSYLVLTGPQQSWVNSQLLTFDPMSLPAGTTTLVSYDKLAPLSWLDNLTIATYTGLSNSAIQTGIQANLAKTWTQLLTTASTVSLANSVAYASYVEPWLVAYYWYPKNFYLASNGDVYINAVVSGKTVSSLRIPAEYLSSGL